MTQQLFAGYDFRSFEYQPGVRHGIRAPKVRRSIRHILRSGGALLLAGLLLPLPGREGGAAVASPAGATKGQPVIVNARYFGSVSEVYTDKFGTTTAKLTWDGSIQRSIPLVPLEPGARALTPTDTYKSSASGSVVFEDKLYGKNRTCNLGLVRRAQTGLLHIDSPQYANDSSERDHLTILTGVPALIGNSTTGPLMVTGGNNCYNVDPETFIVYTGAGVTHNIDHDPEVIKAFSFELDSTLRGLTAAPYTRAFKISHTVPDDSGGTMTIRVTATFTAAVLATCQVTYRVGDQSYDVTGRTMKAVIGQPVGLSVSCGAPTVAPPIRWTVPGLSQDLKTTSAVGDYQIVNGPKLNSARVTPFNMRALAQMEISLRFVRGSTFPVNVTTGAGSARTTVTVEDPVLQAPPEVKFCRVDVGTIPYASPNGRRISPPTIGLGLNDSCGTIPGIAWRFVVALPKVSDGITGKVLGGGIVRLTQLISKKVSNRNGVCAFQRAPLADTSSFYDTTFKGYAGLISMPVQASGGPGAIVTWADTDSPWIQLKLPLNPLPNRYTEEFYAWDYVMYRADIPGSIWMPIGELIWHWTGTALWAPRGALTPNRWELVPGSFFNPTLANSSFTNRVIAPLPQWPDALAGGNDVPGLC